MDKDNICRDATSRIVSEYFSNNPVMGDSPKANKDKQSATKKQQPKANKTQKKRTKKVAGQKDIRTLIKANRNELLKYTKDFDLICKQSGIDVDPEKLQLAIALSKSLEDNKSIDCDETNAEKSLTCNQRRSKIKKTLQEYGFKTKNSPGKKVKRYRKHYKLILVSDTEKQQKIADKFAEILIKNVSISKVNVESLSKNIHIVSNLYNLTTNVEYYDIKDDEIFHINDIVPKTEQKYCTNNKFKDWSKIPGRPVSPKPEEIKQSFKDIECSQKELDNILSGPIDIAQSIVKWNYTNNRLKSIQAEKTPTKVETTQESSIELESKSTFVGVFCENKSIKDSTTFDISFNNSQTMALPVNRSCSPDLFDDEVTIIMDSPKDKISIPEGISERTVMVKEDFMDLTNCIGNINANYSDSKHIACFSQGSNKTRSKSNDFMDLTECIPACSQKISHNVQSIDNLDQSNKNCELINKVNDKDGHDINQTPNFTSSSKPNSAGDENSLDDTIIMIDEDYNNINHGNKNNVTNSTTKQCIIIDLVGAQYESPRMLNIMPKSNDPIVILDENPKDPDDSYVEKNYRYNSPEKDSRSTVPSSAKDKEYMGTIDLTQPVNFKGCINTYKIPTALNSISNNAADLSKFKNAIDSEGDDRLEKCEDVEGIDLTQSPNSEEVLSEACVDKVQNANESEKENGESSEKFKTSEGLDLTQSSNYEDCLEEMNKYESPINNRSLNDTVTFNNEQHNSIILVTNEVGRNNDLNCLDLYNDDKHYSHRIDAQTTKTMKIDIKNASISYDTDNDSEFDNLVKNVSKSNPSTSHLNYKKQSSYLNVSDTAESEPHYQEFDLTQNYECSPYKLSEPKRLSGKSSNMNDDAYSTCNVINDDSCEIEIVNEKVVKNPNNWDEDLEMPEVVTNILETNKNQRKLVTDVDSNSEIDNGQDISDNTQCGYKDKNDQFENVLDEDDHDNQKCDIDLTQRSDYSDTSCSPKNYEVPEELGKRNNISIDYDDVCADTDFRECGISSSLSIHKHKENDKSESKDENASGLSQNSEVFELSDNELNYSIHQSMQDNESLKLKPSNFDIGGISVIDDFLNRKSLPAKNQLRCSCSSNSYSNTNDKTIESCLPIVGTENLLGNKQRKESKSCEEVKFVKITTPLKARSENNILIAKTPKNDDYIIKTDQVTPMPDYENMTSPERNEELDKFGVKPLKRKRAIQILTHIYNQTHPIMEVIPNDEYASPSKIRRKNNTESFPRRVVATQFDTGGELSSQTSETLQHKSKERKRTAKDSQKSPKKVSNNENISYEETTLRPDIRNIECSSEDWVFQKREKAKVHSCRVPLHIAFHNYVSSRKALREAILRYEPINIDDIHKGLVAVGYRYNPKDLLKFMDRKCITVKTADNSKKNTSP